MRLKLRCVILWICEDGLAVLTASVRAVSDEEVRHYARFVRVADNCRCERTRGRMSAAGLSQ